MKYESVYPGVDLVYYGTDQRALEYDFIVSPGADPSAIALAFDGSYSTHINKDGALVLIVGDSEVVLQAPVTYQTIDGKRVAVDSRYLLKSDNRVAFAVGAYDIKEKLVIDPVLSYSTYLGGDGGDYGYGIAVDSSGNAYVTGYTSSTDFPTVNEYELNDTSWDAFVTKVNSAGNAWIYSTYLGGG